MSNSIPTREQDYSEWYNALVEKAGLAEHSAVRGCMVIKPYGYAIWEKMQAALDKMFKDTGHVNAYFPLLIPKSFFSKEASHVKGFAKECAIVTHYRLKTAKDGSLVVDETAKLEEELVIRPTSETIIWSSYKKWIESYRDLPLLINQWANIVRWEMRTRLFLRTAEFLWQEGHTAHATAEEAIEETKKMLDVYADFAENWLALPVFKGVKSESERFAGALDTYCIEAMMQDGKALQAGTSHFLGQNFAKAFDVQFSDKEGKRDFVWATSWGVSTRLMGALVMAHSDDQGLILPPKLAPIQVVIVPAYKDVAELSEINVVARNIQNELKNKGVSVKYDDDDTKRPGWKYAEYELKGVPIRITIGKRDIAANKLEMVRRDTKEKEVISLLGAADLVVSTLDLIQENLYKKALKFKNERTFVVDSWDDFEKKIEQGFVAAHWDGTAETEEKIKELTKATIRCIPLDQIKESGKCVLSGQPSSGRVVFARAY